MNSALRTVPKVVSFVGHSGSGKTTLVEKLILELSLRGLRIAAIKHAHHAVILDTPGKDSFRYKKAGAAISMLVTTTELQLVADAVEDREPEQLAQRFLGEVDLVLAEGFSPFPGFKIEVMRRACGKPPRCTDDDPPIAVVSDMDEVFPQRPHFGLEDTAGIADFILERISPHHEGEEILASTRNSEKID